MKYHDEANRIMDLSTRAEQVSEWKKLPEKDRVIVGELIRVAKRIEQDNRHFSWRVYRNKNRHS